MKLEIKYFGQIAEMTNKSEEVIEVENEITVNDLLKQLEGSYQELKGATVQVAVNHAVVEMDHKINAMSEIALLPPFAGG